MGALNFGNKKPLIVYSRTSIIRSFWGQNLVRPTCMKYSQTSIIRGYWGQKLVPRIIEACIYEQALNYEALYFQGELTRLAIGYYCKHCVLFLYFPTFVAIAK